MHELSIAEALLEQVRRHTPPGQCATLIHVEAGPLQAIDADALQFAWKALTASSDLVSATLELTTLPWHLTCSRCGKSWTAADPFQECACGCQEVNPEGSAEIRLISFETADADTSLAPESFHAEV